MFQQEDVDKQLWQGHTRWYEHRSDGLKFEVKCSQRKHLICYMAYEREMFGCTTGRRFQR